MTTLGVRCLDRAQVTSLGGGDFDAAMADIVDVLALFEAGQARMSPECVLPLTTDDRPGYAYGLPAWVGGRFDAVGLKWSLHLPPQGVGQPSSYSTTLVNHLDGRPRGLVESGLLTAVRTAAVSALALEYAAPGPLTRVAVLGAGFQARTHLSMLAECFPGIERVTIWNRTPSALAWATQRAWPFELVVAASLEEACKGVDALLCCTNAERPLVGEDAVAADRLVLQIGRNEVSFAAIERFDAVLVDLWGEFRLTSAKSLFQMHRAGRFEPARLAATLADLVAGRWRPVPGSSVYFSSFGLNLFDIALAARLLEAAERLEVGSWQPLLTLPGESP